MTQHSVRYFAMMAFLIVTANNHPPLDAAPVPTSSCCNLIEQALKDVSAIHAGSQRSDVERSFTEAGGLSFGQETVYVYKKCHYIKMSVTYRKGTSSLPTDVVATVSPLSIGYEAKD